MNVPSPAAENVVAVLDIKQQAVPPSLLLDFQPLKRKAPEHGIASVIC
jgi:hypothetical protein